jgi:hypothetical protein
LKRPDYSGSLNSFRPKKAQEKLANSANSGAQVEVDADKKKKSKKGDGRKSRADIGQVVQLMSSASHDPQMAYRD